MKLELKMKRTLKFFWKEWMNYKVLFFTLVIAMTTVQALAMLVPIIYKELVDLIINPALDRDYVV